MKKYWQLLVLAVVIVAAIGVHYIQIADAANPQLDFTFETISGDDQYIDTLSIEAHLQDRLDLHSVMISKDEIKVLDRYRYRYIPSEFERLINEHKNFMRGKALNSNNFYEDDVKLIYVEEPEETWKLNKGDAYSFKIDLLNKANNERVSFEVQSELSDKIDWLNVVNIAVVDNEMKPLIREVSNNWDENLFIVVIDLKKQELLSKSLIDSIAGDENERKGIEYYNAPHNLAQEKYYVYSSTVYDPAKEEFSIISRQFNVLNMETNEVTPIQFPEGVDYEIESAVVDNNYFIPFYVTDKETVIYRYNIGQKRWLDPIVVPHTAAIEETSSNNIGAQNGKLFIMNETQKGYVLQIFDIDRGTALYEGLLSSDDTKHEYALSVYRFIDHTE